MSGAHKAHALDAARTSSLHSKGHCRRASDARYSAYMKRLVAIFCLGAALTGGFAQGLINFVNGPSTLVSLGPNGDSLISGVPGSFFFALLTSPVGANTFTFASVYATNQAVAGLLNGGVGVAVNGWAPGTARDFVVVGWSGSLGTTFDPAWFPPHVFGPPGLLGQSTVGTGIAGGSTSSGTLPILDIFGGTTGIQTGFQLEPPLVPEPSGMSLAVLGAALLIFRRRIVPNYSLERTRTSP